ncbi:hypothetical protein ES704_01810 [subsurface metagenome]|jgi:uncharacterized protein YcfL
MKRILLAVFLLSLLLTGCTSTPEAKAKLWTSEPVISRTEYGNVAVEGIVRNDGQETAYFIQAEATFYDSRGNMLTTTSAFLDELAVGQTWKYSIMYLGLKPSQEVSKANVEVTHSL